MADDSGHQELHRNRDPYGAPPVPDGDRVPTPEGDAAPGIPTRRQKLTAALVFLVVVAAVVIGHLR